MLTVRYWWCAGKNRRHRVVYCRTGYRADRRSPADMRRISCNSPALPSRRRAHDGARRLRLVRRHEGEGGGEEAEELRRVLEELEEKLG
jgi:hypothetical protein